MSQASQHSLPLKLAELAADYQTSAVIPHCPKCERPCCKLDTLVLELAWKQVKTLWKIQCSRAVFDQQLATGSGPEEIRAGGDLYYVHQKPCPAYDTSLKTCQIYGQALKPAGCTDFPVYEDQGDLIADLRCEAIDLEALKHCIGEGLGPNFQIRAIPDEDFPFLVTLMVKKSGRKPGR